MSASRPSYPFVIPLWLVWLLAGVTVFSGLGSYGLLNNNEGLYAEIAREMLGAGWRGWIIPHLNGLPYMEKPPLLYWLTALAFRLFGISEWSARLVPAGSALGCVGLLLWFGTRIGQAQAARLAALMFITGFGVFAMARVLMFDMLLTVLLCAALMCAYLYRLQQQPRQLYCAYGMLALALLAKGLVALILFGLVLLAFELGCSRTPRSFLQNLRTWFDWRALAVLFVIAAPWHVAASLVEPAFAWFYFINEHLLRFLGQRQPHDYYAGPWWYYLPRMVLYLFPWSLLLLSLPLLRLQRTRAAWPPLAEPVRFLFLAWLLPLLFFSVSSAKANYYLVTVMPFAALHLSLALQRRAWLATSAAARAWPALLIALFALVALALLWRRPPATTGLPALQLAGLAQAQFGLLAAALFVFVACLVAWLAWRHARGVLTYLLLPLLTGILLALAVRPLEPQISARPLAHYLQQQAAAREVYLYRDFEQLSALPFYLRRPVPVVDARSADLYWGDQLRPQNAMMPSAAEFSARLLQQRIALVVRDAWLAELQKQPFFAVFRQQHQIGNVTVFFN